MLRILTATLLLSSLTLPAFADEVTNIPQVGTHHRPLIVEKSINRQNILSAYTKVDQNCRLATDRKNRDTPVLGFYWLNNRKSYEPLDRSIGSLIRDRLKVETTGRRDLLYVRLTDLGTMRHDLPDPRLKIEAEKSLLSRKCEVEATLQMGPSDHNSTVKVESIYLEMGFMGGVNAITITGKTRISGRKVQRRFAANSGW